MSAGVSVHPTAIVGAGVQLADGVSVGAYSVIKVLVTIGPGTVVHEHCVIGGPTAIGAGCKIGPAACLGMDPQHLRFVADESEPTYLAIGDKVTIRECARLHRSTTPGLEHATRVGDNCFIMGAAHLGHDCVVERSVTLADSALLGGHCHVGERAFIGGAARLSSCGSAACRSSQAMRRSRTTCPRSGGALGKVEGV